MAQLGMPDMRLPIQYALFYPERPNNPLERLDLARCGQLTFEAPDVSRFPALGLAFRAAETGGSLPGVMSAANEAAVEQFLAGNGAFTEIAKCVERVMDAHAVVPSPGLEELLELDAWARRAAVA
jgi:1-deoxy-D-xylulose-5-phosphate reductoisomerase